MKYRPLYGRDAVLGPPVPEVPWLDELRARQREDRAIRSALLQLARWTFCRTNCPNARSRARKKLVSGAYLEEVPRCPNT